MMAQAGPSLRVISLAMPQLAQEISNSLPFWARAVPGVGSEMHCDCPGCGARPPEGGHPREIELRRDDRAGASHVRHRFGSLAAARSWISLLTES